MPGLGSRRSVTLTLLGVAAVAAVAVWLLPGDRHAADDRATTALVEGYCQDCHNSIERTANLAIDAAALADIAGHAEVWEKVVHRLRAGSMPPLGEPRPDPGQYQQVAGSLESRLDAAAAENPNAGQLPQLHRLTRTEYQHAIRDLLGLDHLPAEMDFELLLPPDNASSGFDNIAELLFVSPVMMERYLDAARKIARLAVGDMGMPPMVNRYRLPLELPQDEPLAGLPLGTRGGIGVNSYFPLDANYEIHVEFSGRAPEPHTVELTLDGARVAEGMYDPTRRGEALEFVIPVSAGPHLLGVTFVQRGHVFDESVVRMQRRSRGSLPAIELVTINGPLNATGPGDTPSRALVFTCTPGPTLTAEACATEILGRLARRAYRRTVTAADLEPLLAFFAAGSAEAGFDAGIQRALERLLVSPQFLYRIERIPEGVTPGRPFAISPVELASRLSFFLWSSLPDARLLELAESGRLVDPQVLAGEVSRMLADPKSAALVTNFAAQWLFLRDVEGKDPDLFIFRDYDEGLRESLVTETEMFVASILQERRSVLDLITANYTFLNERLARHYGIPYIEGERFRRVTLPAGSPRGGLLGQGSILTLTSYPTRTSPVLRGKYVLDNLLAAPPPPPPPDVPALDADDHGERATQTLREAMAAHRANPECASCHAEMDPIGFALENFDATGRWRETDGGLPIEAASVLRDGSVIDGIDGIRQLLLRQPERFVSAITEKLLMYALGRNIQYYDRPAIRAIVTSAAADNYSFEALISGIVESVPFRLRQAPTAPEAAAE